MLEHAQSCLLFVVDRSEAKIDSPEQTHSPFSAPALGPPIDYADDVRFQLMRGTTYDYRLSDLEMMFNRPVSNLRSLSLAPEQSHSGSFNLSHRILGGATSSHGHGLMQRTVGPTGHLLAISQATQYILSKHYHQAGTPAISALRGSMELRSINLDRVHFV
jgi:hypothetical protein